MVRTGHVLMHMTLCDGILSPNGSTFRLLWYYFLVRNNPVFAESAEGAESVIIDVADLGAEVAHRC